MVAGVFVLGDLNSMDKMAVIALRKKGKQHREGQFFKPKLEARRKIEDILEQKEMREMYEY